MCKVHVYNLTKTLIRNSRISSAVQTLTYVELLAAAFDGSTCDYKINNLSFCFMINPHYCF